MAEDGGAQAAPLTPEQRDALSEARDASGRFLGAAKFAAFNGWTLAFFGVVSLLVGLFSVTSLLVGIALCVLAWNELRGRKALRAFDPEGLELLWKNQFGLMAVIVVYCAWSMYRATALPDPQMAELAQVLGPGTEELVQDLTLGVYAAVIAATVIVQGLAARYYHVRAGRLREYVARTPDWILDFQRSANAD